MSDKAGFKNDLETARTALRLSYEAHATSFDNLRTVLAAVDALVTQAGDIYDETNDSAYGSLVWINTDVLREAGENVLTEICGIQAELDDFSE